MKGSEENQWCMGREGCALWEAEWSQAAWGLFSARAGTLGEVRVFETLDLAKTGTYECCWHQAMEHPGRSLAQSWMGIFWWKFCQNRNFLWRQISPFKLSPWGQDIQGYNKPLTSTLMANKLTWFTEMPVAPEGLFWYEGYFTSTLPFSRSLRRGEHQGNTAMHFPDQSWG